MTDYLKEGIKIIKVGSQAEGDDFVKELLYKNSDPRTVIFLSGGKTPKTMYDQILLENKLKAGAFAMTDDRYGNPNHERSNALIMKYFSPFYPILTGESLEKTALDYDETVRYLLNYFPKSIFLAGIGNDGHTVGIPAIPHIVEKILEDRSSLVLGYDGKDGFYNERVTMTFAALAKMDQIIIMAFGKEKEDSLKKMFKVGPISEIPSRFYKEVEIAPKVILVTDQKV